MATQTTLDLFIFLKDLRKTGVPPYRQPPLRPVLPSHRCTCSISAPLKAPHDPLVTKLRPAPFLGRPLRPQDPSNPRKGSKKDPSNSFFWRFHIVPEKNRLRTTNVLPRREKVIVPWWDYLGRWMHRTAAFSYNCRKSRGKIGGGATFEGEFGGMNKDGGCVGRSVGLTLESTMFQRNLTNRRVIFYPV